MHNELKAYTIQSYQSKQNYPHSTRYKQLLFLEQQKEATGINQGLLSKSQSVFYIWPVT